MGDTTTADGTALESWDRQSSPVVVDVPGTEWAPLPTPLLTPPAHLRPGHRSFPTPAPSSSVDRISTSPSGPGSEIAAAPGADPRGDTDPFESLAATILAHFRGRPGAVVVLTGPYGAGHTDVVGAVNRGIRAVSDSGFAYVPRVDLLDEEHIRTVDGVVREGTRPVLFTAAEAPARYAGVLESRRGLSLALRPLDRGAAAAVIRGLTGVEPLGPALTYLLELTGGLRGLLVSTVRMGLAERWLARSGGRLIVGRSPSFTDRGWAEQEIGLIARMVGADGIGLLSSLAASGPQQLSQVMRDPATRREVVRLEQLGVVHFEHAAVALHPPLLAHALRLVDLTTENAATDGLVAAGDEDEVLREALADLEHGLLGHAYQHLEALDSPSATAVRAVVDAVNGRPRTSMETLSSLMETTGSHEFAALRDVVRVFTVRGFTLSDEEVRVEPSDPHLRELSRAARIVSDVARTFAPSADGRRAELTATGRVTRLLDGLLADVETAPRAEGDGWGSPCSWLWPEHTGGADAVPLPDFAEICAMVSRALAAAVLGRDDDARAALAHVEHMDLTRLPVIGATWVVEHLGLARLLVDVDTDPVPHDWFSGESPARPLLRSVSTTALGLVGALCRGESSPDLLGRLTDLWAVFETRKPPGIVSRDHVDALDFAVAGPMSTDLIGPPGADAVTSDRRPMFVSVRGAVEAGRLLRCAPDGLIDDWNAAAHWALPGIKRLLARTVALRRVGTLPAQVCGAFADIADDAGVEPEIVALLRARAADAPDEYDAARAVLQRTRPALTIPRWEPGGEHDAVRFERSLRTSRLTDLTARERAVVVRVVSGDGTDRIADALGISPRTVETHVRNAYRKLGVRSRTELRAEIVR